MSDAGKRLARRFVPQAAIRARGARRVRRKIMGFEPCQATHSYAGRRLTLDELLRALSGYQLLASSGGEFAPLAEPPGGRWFLVATPAS